MNRLERGVIVVWVIGWAAIAVWWSWGLAYNVVRQLRRRRTKSGTKARPGGAQF